jgi:hypothetical protein
MTCMFATGRHRGDECRCAQCTADKLTLSGRDHAGPSGGAAKSGRRSVTRGSGAAAATSLHDRRQETADDIEDAMRALEQQCAVSANVITAVAAHLKSHKLDVLAGDLIDQAQALRRLGR